MTGLPRIPTCSLTSSRFAFRAMGDTEPRQADAAAEARVLRCWSVLRGWRWLPGIQEDGSVDTATLSAWVQRARALLLERDRADIGDEYLGQLLSGSRPAPMAPGPARRCARSWRRRRASTLTPAWRSAGLTLGVSTGTLTRTTPSGNRTRARGRGPSPGPGTVAPPPLRSRQRRPARQWRGRPQRQRFGLIPAALACPACGHQPASRPEALRQREDLAIVWLRQDSPSGPFSQHRHCASCQPHVECGTVVCAHCGDGPVLTGALADQLRKHDPNQPTALRAWLTSHGWQLEPEPLCPADSNSIKD